MAHKELDSSFLKFKNLWQAGWNAKLSLKSNEEKAEAHLSVELEDAPVIQKSRNGPSRQRRRERRAAARKAEKATERVNVDTIVAVEASNVPTVEENVANSNVENIVETNKNATIDKKIHEDQILLQDEFCSDQLYLDSLDDDTPVEEILVEASCEANLDEEAFKNLLNYNMKVLGMNKVKAKTMKSESGVISCEVIIQPSQKQSIKSLDFPLSN